MSKKNITESGLEFIENPEALAGQLGKAESFFERQKKLFSIAGGALVVGLALFAGYRFYIDGQESSAQKALSNAVYDFEADSLQKALKGAGGNEGLLAIADGFTGTKASNLAKFYSGVALLKQGKFDEAIEQLKGFSSSDLLVQGRAYSLIGDAYMEKNQASEAVSYYEKAANYQSNSFLSPSYLLKLGIAQEKNKQNDKAIEAYKKIIEKYPLSSEVVKAKKFLGILESQAIQ